MDNLHFLLGEVRRLTKESRVGDRKGFIAFKNLVTLLLRSTILKKSEAIQLSESLAPIRFVIGGTTWSLNPLKLSDGHYLRLGIDLLPDTDTGRLTVQRSSYQYQPKQDSDAGWIFRYDYFKEPPLQFQHPQSHLQVNAKLPQGPFGHRDLRKIHFPVGRMSLEAVIRLLAEEFHVPCNKAAKIWRPILAESERLFHEVAHTPLSGSSR